MSQIRVITDPETIKVVSDGLRLKILDLMQRLRPASATVLAEELGESAPKISYHLKQLEKYDLIHLVETRTKGNLIENLYAPTAEQFLIQRDLSAPVSAEFSEAILQAVQQINALLSADLLRLPYVKTSLNFPSTVSFGSYYLTKEEITELEDMMREKFASFERKPGPGRFACDIGFQLFDLESLQGGRHEE